MSMSGAPHRNGNHRRIMKAMHKASAFIIVKEQSNGWYFQPKNGGEGFVYHPSSKEPKKLRSWMRKQKVWDERAIQKITRS